MRSAKGYLPDPFREQKIKSAKKGGIRTVDPAQWWILQIPCSQNWNGGCLADDIRRNFYLTAHYNLYAVDYARGFRNFCNRFKINSVEGQIPIQKRCVLIPTTSRRIYVFWFSGLLIPRGKFMKVSGIMESKVLGDTFSSTWKQRKKRMWA